jgi:hypothetical protein
MQKSISHQHVFFKFYFFKITIKSIFVLLNLVFFLNYNPQNYHNDKHKSNYGRLIKELFFLAKPVEDLCGFT